MKAHITTALLLAVLALPHVAAAQGRQDDDPYQVYPAEPVGPEASDYGVSGDYDVSVDLDGGPGVSLSTFEGPLSAYGDWVPAGSLGRAWRPRVPAGWRPYYYGRWEWTTEGWLWVSDEPFGWATYHYGRWSWDRGLGWLWVPGFQWAPAWVSWRYSGDVVGWAPLAPGLSLYVTDFAFVDFWWTFVPTVRFCGVPVHGIAYAPGHARRWYDSTRPAPPRPGSRGSYRPAPGRPPPPAWGGPSPRFVEERLGRPLRPARIVPAATPGGARLRAGEIGVFRPEARSRAVLRGDPGRSPATRPSPGWDRGRDRYEQPGRSRAPGTFTPPGRGREEGPGWNRGRPQEPAPGLGPRAPQAPRFERQEQRGQVAPPPGRAAPAERAPSYQPLPRRPESPASPPPSRGRGEDRRDEGGRGDRRR